MTVQWNSPAVIQRVEQAAMRGVVRGTEGVREEAVSLILETQKTGRIYRRRGVTHQASAPGEPFANDLGNALSQIQTIYQPERLAGIVNFGAAYAAALEFGTSRMEPRPVARPALANRREEIERDIGQEIDQALSG